MLLFTCTIVVYEKKNIYIYYCSGIMYFFLKTINDFEDVNHFLKW